MPTRCESKAGGGAYCVESGGQQAPFPIREYLMARQNLADIGWYRYPSQCIHQSAHFSARFDYHFNLLLICLTVMPSAYRPSAMRCAVRRNSGGVLR